jgi:hypothetical protein
MLMLVLAIMCCAQPGCASRPGPGEHPRLLVKKADLAAFRQRLASGALPGILAEVKSRADQLLKTPAKPPAPARAITTGRQIERQVMLLAAVYLATGDERYAKAAYEYMMFLDQFASWVSAGSKEPADLMTASACLAVGLGYDWTYPALKQDQRERLRSLLVSKGLAPYVSAVEQGAWWAHERHNWNLVTNSGCAIGALAVLGEEPIADRALSLARENVTFVWNAMPADGGWEEGLGYWQYAMQHALLFAACLRTAVGTDDGVFSLPGIRQTGFFPVTFTGPDGSSVAFCDDGTGAPGIPIFYLLASEYRRPEFAWQRRKYGRGAEPLDLFWMPDSTPDFDSASLPRTKLYESIGWAMMRANPAALDQDIYLAFKSGDIKASHSHADINSFVLSAFGERLLLDPGAGPYVPDYWVSSKRYQFYQASTRGHNTILVNGQGQDPKSKGEIAAFESAPDYDWLLGRAGECYGDALNAFDRVLVFVDRKYFVIMDDLQAPNDSDFQWLLHTRADVTRQDWGATISGKQAALDVHVVSPAPFSLATEKGEAKDTILAISPELRSQNQRFVVVLYPRLRSAEGVSVRPSPHGLGVMVKLPSGRTDEITFGQHAGQWMPRVKLGR